MFSEFKIIVLLKFSSADIEIFSCSISLCFAASSFPCTLIRRLVSVDEQQIHSMMLQHLQREGCWFLKCGQHKISHNIYKCSHTLATILFTHLRNIVLFWQTQFLLLLFMTVGVVGLIRACSAADLGDYSHWTLAATVRL